MGVTPDLRDIPWRALDWKYENFTWAPLGIAEGTKVTFRVRSDMYWNDGFPIDVNDMKFSWEFMRNFPRFYSTYLYLLWVEIEDPQTISIYLDTTSQFIVYDYAGLALWFPEHIYAPYYHPVQDTIGVDPSNIAWTAWMADYTGPETSLSNTPYPYTALVNCGDYNFMSYDDTAQVALLDRHFDYRMAGLAYNPGWEYPLADFFEDDPLEGYIDMPGRVGYMELGSFVGGPFDYKVQIINQGSKDNVTKELVDCIIGSYRVLLDDVVVTTNTINYPLAPFDNVTAGYHTLPIMTPGLHKLTVEVYEAGVAHPKDISDKYIYVTPREDLNYDFFIGIDDIVRAAEAFGASPPPFPGNERWDARADLNDDQYCGIDDIVNIAEDFGGP
jgi:hypothetical protein